MKKIFFCSILFISGCSYMSKKSDSFSDIKFDYETVVKKGEIRSDLHIKKACSDTYALLIDLLSNKDSSKFFLEDKDGKCFYYINSFKPKVLKKTKDADTVSYKFIINSEKLISELKEKQAFSKALPDILFLADKDIYEFKDSLKLDFANLDFKIKGETYDSSKYDFILDSYLINSEIKTAVSSVYFSSFTANIINSYTGAQLAEFKTSAISQLSFEDAVKKLAEDLNSKLYQKKDVFNIKHYTFKIYGYQKYSYLSGIVSVLKQNNLKFSVDSLNSEFLSIKIYKKDSRTLQELVSLFLKDVKNLSIDSIDEENNSALFYFSNTGLNIL